MEMHKWLKMNWRDIEKKIRKKEKKTKSGIDYDYVTALRGPDIETKLHKTIFTMFL